MIRSRTGSVGLAALSLGCIPALGAPLVPCESNPPSSPVAANCDHWYDDPFLDAAFSAAHRDDRPGTIVYDGAHAPRPSTITAFGQPASALVSSALQVMYVSRDADGNPSAGVATIIQPTRDSLLTPRPLVSYQTAQDGLSERCAPSYTYRKGQDKDEVALPFLLAQGWAVVISDYEGLRSQYTVGLQAAHGVLDGIRAALNWAEANRGAALFGGASPIGLWGYSGGALASAWASELASTYAPELTGRIVGVAEGGVPADVHSIAKNLDGGAFSGVLLAGSVGLSRAVPWLKTYENAAGRAMDEDIGTQCIEQFTAPYAFKHEDDYTTVPDVIDVPEVRAVIDMNSLGRNLEHLPNMPVYIYEAINDELIPVAGVNALVDTYCANGVHVTYYQDAASEHVSLALSGAQGALAYLNARFLGLDVPDTCPVPRAPPNR